MCVWRVGPEATNWYTDEYEYGMCGKVFKYEHLSDKKVAAVASFGGLLMLLKGEQNLVRIALDQKVYALIRKDGGKGAT